MALLLQQPSNWSARSVLHVGKHFLFVVGCLVGFLALWRSTLNGIALVPLGGGAFALAFAVDAAEGIADGRRLGPGLELLVAVGVAMLTVGPYEVVDPGVVFGLLIAASLVRLWIGGTSAVGIKQGEDPVNTGGTADQGPEGGGGWG